MLSQIRPNFSRQLRSLNQVCHGFASKTPIEQGNKFLKSFKDLLTNLVFQKPPLILGNKKPEGIPMDALDTPSKQLGYMRMKISQIKIGNLNENQQLILAHTLMVMAKYQLPEECTRILSDRVRTVTTLTEPMEAVFNNGILFEKDKEIDSNIFSYITQHVDESSVVSSQHIFRGISEAQPLPKFDGNVLVEFSPNPKVGISIPTFLDICALDPHKYVKQFGDLLGTQDPSSFSRQLKVIKSVLSNECELAVSRPIPSCCVHSIARIKLSEAGYSMMGSPSKNPKYNPEKFQYPGELKECLLFAIKNDLFKTE